MHIEPREGNQLVHTVSASFGPQTLLFTFSEWKGMGGVGSAVVEPTETSIMV